MRLLRFFAIFVALAGVAALALVAAPSVYGAFGQDRSFDSLALSLSKGDLAQDRPESQRRARELTVLAGRGAQIGVRIADGSAGVVVEEVEPDSPAEKAGVKRSDVFVEFDGERVRSARQFSRLVEETPPGRTVKATVTRDGQRKDLQITPNEGRIADVIINGDRLRERFGDLSDFAGRMPFNFNFDFDMPSVLSGRRLGVTVDNLTQQLAEYFGAKDGVLVTSVTEGSAAARAGMKAGDVITSINGDRVTSREELVRRLRDASGEDITIGVVRDKKETTLKAKIEPARRLRGARPA
jgi:S1-C subfamily serine protease